MKNLIALSLLASSVLAGSVLAQDVPKKPDPEVIVPHGIFAVVDPSSKDAAKVPVEVPVPGASRASAVSSGCDTSGDRFVAQRAKGCATTGIGRPHTVSNPPPLPPTTKTVLVPKDPIQVSSPDEACTVAHPGVCTLQVNFASGSSAVLPEDRPKLLAIGREMVAAPPSARFLIEGYTDTVGTDPYNKALSERRAASVRNYLAMNFPTLDGRFVARGWGKENLLIQTPDQVPEPKNRRALFEAF